VARREAASQAASAPARPPYHLGTPAYDHKGLRIHRRATHREPGAPDRHVQPWALLPGPACIAYAPATGICAETHYQAQHHFFNETRKETHSEYSSQQEWHRMIAFLRRELAGS
jgi:hypothetical protein